VNKFLHIAALLALLASTDLHAATSNYCGELKNAYGPYDYRTRAEHQENFHLIEMAHFTPDVENGVKGATGLIGGDLDYTLRAVPNHHRALATLSTLALRDRSYEIPGMHHPVECYFIRALRLTPDDGAVYATYGSYLFSLGKTDKAAELFKQGISYEPENPTLNYNMGLIAFKQHDYVQAKTYAKKAYAAGFPLPGLRNKLIEAKQWDEAPEN
jgi:tetratricopeptide (TPR) repeat protein